MPVRPLAGSALELRATSGRDLQAVDVELDVGGRRSRVAARDAGEAVPEVDGEYGLIAARADGGHLADAVSRMGTQHGRTSWRAKVAAPGKGERLRYRFVGGEQRTRWFSVCAVAWEPAPDVLRIEATQPQLASRVVGDRTEVLTDGEIIYGLRFGLRLEAGERVVGFGERYDGLDQRGHKVDIAVFDQYKGQGGRSYLPMPFAHVLGPDGFSFHLDTGHRVRFDVGVTDADVLLATVDLEPGLPEASLPLRLWGGSPAEALASFLDATGTVDAPPPEWIYRLWMSGNEWNTQADVEREVARHEAEDVPVGALVIEAWSDEETFVAWNGARYAPHPDGSPHRLADFTFPSDGPWPDPKAMVDDLHRRGVKVLLWQIPLVASRRGQAGMDREVMVEQGYCVRRDDGLPYRNRGWWFPGALMPDFTNPDATRWWIEKRRYLLDEMAIDGFKTDGGEHAWGADLRYADGTTGGETNNRFPVRYHAAYHQLMAESGIPPVTFSRAGFTGSAAVPCHWAGDEDSTWEAFRASICAGLSAAACGIVFWGWDLGGFSGPVPDPELYLRSAAAACFSPIMQYHSEYNHHRTPSRDRTPWNVGEQTGDARVVKIFGHFARLRERLVPYLAEAGAAAVKARGPLMQPLFFATPGDERVWEFPDEYLLGPDLLVAPVTEPGATTRRLYVPQGTWVDPWTGEEIRGATVITREAPLDQIPVLVRSSAAQRLLGCFTPRQTSGTTAPMAEVR
ncbi:MAG: glycoside hydrolase family 31 [Acidimicrobiaceae bacterium]|nr:glycoside hydrolase family 31 [Acidimicrobiaceae bacterium]